MTIRSPEIEEAILSALMGGESLRSICSRDGMPDRATVFRWMAADDEFATKCARARLIQADALEDDMADIEDKTLSGDIEPAAARAVLSSKQWRASKLAPKKYGDRQVIAGDPDAPLEVNATHRLSPASRTFLEELASPGAGPGVSATVQD